MPLAAAAANPSQSGTGWTDASQTTESHTEEGSLLAAGARWAGGRAAVSGGGGFGDARAAAPNRREYPSLGAAADAADAEADADLYARRHDPSGRRWDEDERKGSGVSGVSLNGGVSLNQSGDRFERGRPFRGHDAYGASTRTSQTERAFERDARGGRDVRGPDGWPVRRGDRRERRRADDDDEDDPFSKAEAEERAFRAAHGAFASGNRDAPRGSPGDARNSPREADASFGGPAARDGNVAAAAEALRAGGPGPGGFLSLIHI